MSSSLLHASRILRQQPVAVVARRTFAASSEPLVKTALYDLHKELQGDMVPFAGYELPVLYKGENGGIMKEHLWCRSQGKASMFDVSHMGQVSFCLFDMSLMNDDGRRHRTSVADGKTNGRAYQLLSLIPFVSQIIYMI